MATTKPTTMEATVNLVLTFPFDDEREYAETLIDVLDRAKELATIKSYSVGRRRHTDPPTPEPLTDPLRQDGVDPTDDVPGHPGVSNAKYQAALDQISEPGPTTTKGKTD